MTVTYVPLVPSPIYLSPPPLPKLLDSLLSSGGFSHSQQQYPCNNLTVISSITKMRRGITTSDLSR